MQRTDTNENGDKIVALLRETADGFGCLMAAHLKLARVEILSDMRSIGRQAATLAGLVFLVIVGYAMSCLGLAAVLSRWLGVAGALFSVGGVHILGGTVAMLVALRRLSRTRLLHETAQAAGQSVSALSARVMHGAAPHSAVMAHGISGEQANQATPNVVAARRYATHVLGATL